MVKTKRHLKENWQSMISFVVMLFIIFGMLYQIYDFSSFTLDIPLLYEGGDDFGVYLVAKMLVEQPWCLSTNRLGAPYSAEFYDFSSNCLNNVGRLIMKFFAMITQDAVMTVNLTYFSIFFIAGIISYFVMRNLKINCWISSLLSSVFAISPYMLHRNIGHIDLAECYFVPLSILLCIWIYERDDIFVLDKNFFKRKINYIVLFFTILIANNGIAYYPFFTCFLLVITIISKCLKTHKLKNCKSGVMTIAFISLFLVISLIPSFVYKYVNGSNSIAVSRSGFAESELFGLKIFQLFMPLNGHGIYDDLISYYSDNTLYYNAENAGVYLGVVGIIGFVVLLVVFFMRERGDNFKKLGFLSELNIMMVLFATTGGFSSMFAFYISSMLRGYARISIFIEYVCLLGLAILLTSFVHKITETNTKHTLKQRCLYSLLALLCVFSIWEGSPDTPDYQTIQSDYSSDKAFIQEIESNVEEGSMIYQLPYHKYPEAGPVNGMWDYDLLTGYLYSDTLKWSYGSIKGREGDAWNENVSQMEYSAMVSYLKEEGFVGIYIDRRAYTQEEIENLENELLTIVGSEPIQSDNGNLSFFQF